MVTEVKPRQFMNAAYLMLVTLFGIVIEKSSTLSEYVNSPPEKALCPMVVTVFGMMVFLHPLIKVFVADSMIALQSLRES